MGTSNAASGRKPKPHALKVFQGSYIPKKRPPLIVPVAAPVCPDWLDDWAKEEWARVVPQLVEIGLISLIDAGALAGYCQAYSLSRNTDPSIKLKALGMLRTYCAEFGMTPSSRGRMEFPDRKKKAIEDEGMLD